MPALTFETVEALVYDPVSASRSSLRGALSALGFGNIDTVSAPVDFAYANYRSNPDVLFCEIQTGESIICDQIQALRAGAIGNNPFAVVVATTWDKSEAHIRRVINSGADDILLRPFSNGILSAHIDALVTRRKGFVITFDYIGPDRRRDPGRVSNTRLFDAPNTLNLKAVQKVRGIAGVKRIETEIATAREYLMAEKMRVDVFQIGVLYRLLRDSPHCGDGFIQDVDRIGNLARSVSRRGSEAQMSAVLPWCGEILHALEFMGDPDTHNQGLKMLERASIHLYTALVPDKSVVAYTAALDTAITAIRARTARGGGRAAGSGEITIQSGAR